MKKTERHSPPTVPIVFSRSDLEKIRDGNPNAHGILLRPRCHEAGLIMVYADGVASLTCHTCQRPVMRLAVGEWSGPGPKDEVLAQVAQVADGDGDGGDRFTGDVPGEIVSPQKLDSAARKNRRRKR